MPWSILENKELSALYILRWKPMAANLIALCVITIY